MTNEEASKRVHSIDVFINAQRGYDLKDKEISKKIKEMFGEEPDFNDDYSEEQESQYFREVVPLIQDYLESDDFYSNSMENVNYINQQLIGSKEGATIEQVAEYIEQNDLPIDFLDINSYEFRGEFTSIEDSLIGYSLEHGLGYDGYDLYGGSCDLARDLAKKGIQPGELPQELLTDLSFISDYVQAVAYTRDQEIDKDYSSPLIEFVEYLQQRKKTITIQDIVKAIGEQGMEVGLGDGTEIEKQQASLDEHGNEVK